MWVWITILTTTLDNAAVAAAHGHQIAIAINILQAANTILVTLLIIGFLISVYRDHIKIMGMYIKNTQNLIG